MTGRHFLRSAPIKKEITMDNSSGGREEYRLNHQFRLQRRLELAQRLRERFVAGKATDKVAVTVTRNFLGNFSMNLTKEECGRIVKQAFPGVCRKRSSSKWFYFGLQESDGKATNPITSTSNIETYVEQESENVNQAVAPSSVKKGTDANQECGNVYQNGCSGDLPQKAATPSSLKKGTDANQECENVNQNVASSPASVYCGTAAQAKKQQSCVNLRPFSIPSLNLCVEDMSDVAHGELIGEGTFGQCIAGTYKGVPVAFKIFKDLDCLEDVHTEAKILLKIPSHPGIPMLIGIHTTSAPFVLATKLCESAGKPQTYSHFLKEEEHSKHNLTLSLQLLLSVGEALNHLFSVGILHNDIKGNNVVLEDLHGVKRGVLIDFGKACSVENAKESTRHKVMNFNERRQYRERYPHVSPELSNGEKPTPASDLFSFGHMYCSTMKKMKGVLTDERKELLELGKQMTHFRPQKRPQIAMALKELARLITILLNNL